MYTSTYNVCKFSVFDLPAHGCSAFYCLSSWWLCKNVMLRTAILKVLWRCLICSASLPLVPVFHWHPTVGLSSSYVPMVYFCILMLAQTPKITMAYAPPTTISLIQTSFRRSPLETKDFPLWSQTSQKICQNVCDLPFPFIHKCGTSDTDADD